MEQILVTIKKLIPTAVFKALQPAYHYTLNFIAALVYGFPSNKLTIVGVTGTTGKTTVAYLAAQMLNGAGVKTGYTSTAMFGDGEHEWLNDKKMTMLGRFFTQKMLAQMVRNECQVAIVETTSEGIAQFRHRFINYDVLLFTGLYPEHIESHGGFESYKNAKLELFRHLERCAKKKQTITAVPKTIIVNGDDEHAHDFLSAWAEEKIVVRSDVGQRRDEHAKDIFYHYKETNIKGVHFDFDAADVQLQLLGDFSALNAALAGSIGKALRIENKKIVQGLEKITGVPGRLEKIDAGQDFTVIVDYAFEPVAVAKLYETIAPLHATKIIHVLGAVGGGRDTARRPALGRIAAQNADVVIVTNEDPYDDDPQMIIDAVADGAAKEGKRDGDDLYRIRDRGAAIEKAITLAHENDAVLITGKGSEQAIVVADNKKIPWDDRDAVRRALKKAK